MAGVERWYFTKEQLADTPSRRSGTDSDKELSYRQQAASLIQDMGRTLLVSENCTNTAIVYMHRFYMWHPFSKFHRYTIATCAFFLAAKVEEQHRTTEHVLKAAHLCLHRNVTTFDPKTEAYLKQADELLINEKIMLPTLGFDLSIDHPHEYVDKCCQLVHANSDLTLASNLMATNSLHLTTMCLQYKPSTVACFSIYFASKWTNWNIPQSSEGKDWFWYVDQQVTNQLLEEMTSEFMDIYDKCPSRLKRLVMSIKSSSTMNESNPSRAPPLTPDPGSPLLNSPHVESPSKKHRQPVNLAANRENLRPGAPPGGGNKDQHPHTSQRKAIAGGSGKPPGPNSSQDTQKGSDEQHKGNSHLEPFSVDENMSKVGTHHHHHQHHHRDCGDSTGNGTSQRTLPQPPPPQLMLPRVGGEDLAFKTDDMFASDNGSENRNRLESLHSMMASDKRSSSGNPESRKVKITLNKGESKTSSSSHVATPPDPQTPAPVMMSTGQPKLIVKINRKLLESNGKSVAPPFEAKATPEFKDVEKALDSDKPVARGSGDRGNKKASKSEASDQQREAQSLISRQETRPGVQETSTETSERIRPEEEL